MKNIIKEKYDLAPSCFGVYLMKDFKGKIIYVGKAKNLKKRLSSYFIKEKGHDLKTNILVKNIKDFEIIVTSNEYEALILESNLIKKYKPKYNIILKDGKNYPCLRLDTSEKYPTLEFVRNIKNDKADYFGPYPSSSNVKKTLKEVNKIFKLRKCKINSFTNRSRPCIQFQIKTCLGPCCNNVSEAKYNKIVNNVKFFLKGRYPQLIKNLKQEMFHKAEKQEFEQAAIIRDTIFAIEKILEKQIVVSKDIIDKDVIACAVENKKAVITIMFIRSGCVVGNRHFSFNISYNQNSKILESFLKQYYTNNIFIPSQILVSQNFDDRKLIQDQLSIKKGKKVKILLPEKGEKKRIIEMVDLNAQSELKTCLAKDQKAYKDLTELQKLLKMDIYPEHIECFDNSNIAGTNPVSSMVVFKNAVPEKSLYRKFIIKDIYENNDYAYMHQVLKRRFSKDQDMPDLLVVDGGKGQLSIAVNVLYELGLENKFQIVGLAKKNSEKGEEYDKIYIPGRSNPLNTTNSLKALYLLERLRDEEHRFAISFQRKIRSKQSQTSILHSSPGIGKKRKQLLLTYYKGITDIKKANLKRQI